MVKTGGLRAGFKAIDPIDAIYEKADRDPVYRKQLNRELDGLGMPWLKAPEPDPASEPDDAARKEK